MEEIWKTHPVHIKYQISNTGRVKSFAGRNGHRILKPWPAGKGYLQVALGNKVRKSVHVVVLETFVGPCPEGMQCRHLNGNPADNRLENLCWGTPEEDWEDKRRHGTVRILKGEECPYSKLTENKIREIRGLYTTGNYTQKKIAEIYELHQVTVSEIILRKIWKGVI